MEDVIEGVQLRGGIISTGINHGQSLGPAGVILGPDMSLHPPTDLSLCTTVGSAPDVTTMRLEVTNLFRTYSASNHNSSQNMHAFSAMS